MFDLPLKHEQKNFKIITFLHKLKVYWLFLTLKCLNLKEFLLNSCYFIKLCFNFENKPLMYFFSYIRVYYYILDLV